MSKRKRLLAVFDMDSTIAQTFIEQSLFHSVPQSEIMHFAKLPVPWPHKLKMAM
jgi:phosphoserine phosphatase